jgi:hypothetical protein
VIVEAGQLVRVTAVVGQDAVRRAAVSRCCTFLPLLPPVRIAVPYTAAHVARRRAGFLPFPDQTRGCRRIQDVPPEVPSVFWRLV